ncbi:TNF receptor-associated factor 3-like isoform X1 [Oculina patagonica]
MDEEVAVFESRFGGHDFEFLDELSSGQTCSVCLLAMRDPVQTMCGHRFCESCLLGTFREGQNHVCPQDRNPIPEDGGFFRDVAWEREILSLRVKCKKKKRGCDWTGQLRHYEEHFHLCKYEDVTCDDCNKEMQRRLLHKHTASECDNRIVQCEYCKKEFQFWVIRFHKDIDCARFPLDCPRECGVKKIPREEVESHVRDVCTMTMVVCPYEGAGCAFYDKRSNLKAHLQFASEEHLSKTWSKLLKTTERLSELEVVEDQIGELQTDKESMKRVLDKNGEEISDLRLSEKKLDLENMTLKIDVKHLQKELEEVKRTAANDREEISSLKQLVQTMQTKFDARDEKKPQCRTCHLKVTEHLRKPIVGVKEEKEDQVKGSSKKNSQVDNFDEKKPVLRRGKIQRKPSISNETSSQEERWAKFSISDDSGDD